MVHLFALFDQQQRFSWWRHEFDSIPKTKLIIRIQIRRKLHLHWRVGSLNLEHSNLPFAGARASLSSPDCYSRTSRRVPCCFDLFLCLVLSHRSNQSSSSANFEVATLTCLLTDRCVALQPRLRLQRQRPHGPLNLQLIQVQCHHLHPSHHCRYELIFHRFGRSNWHASAKFIG